MKQQVAVYLRISQEDLNLRTNALKDESFSISAQRHLIISYLDADSSLAALPRLEFKDDGFSGTNQNRPGFQQMIDRIKKGEISTVIVKDLSRFGRDYIDVGDYLEHIFPYLGIRIISINDGYDSDVHKGQTIGIDVALRNLIYDYYSKDLSAKVKAGMGLHQQKAAYTNCITYGYIRHPDKKHCMIINPETACIVREIFSMRLEGYSTTEIARTLNGRGVLTPEAYRRSTGSRKAKEGLPPQWTHQAVLSILSNVKYTGTMVNHLRESRTIRDKGVRVPKSEWFYRENAHEAIIRQRDFDRVQAMLNRRGKKSSTDKPNPPHPYYCAHCGHKLQLQNRRIYACPSKLAHHHSPCAEVHWRKSELDAALHKAIQDKLGAIVEAQSDTSSPTSLQCLAKLNHIEKQIDRIDRQKVLLYQKYRNKQLSGPAFKEENRLLTEQALQLQEKKAELMTQHQNLLEAETKKITERSLEEKFGQLPTDQLEKELYEAVSRVVVYDRHTLEIYWQDSNEITKINNRADAAS